MQARRRFVVVSRAWNGDCITPPPRPAHAVRKAVRIYLSDYEQRSRLFSILSVMMGFGREATASARTQVSGAYKPLPDDPVSKPMARRDFTIEDARLAKTMPAGELSAALSGALMQYVESPLPPAVANVPKEDVRSFLHHKRVGNYLLGRTLGEGSFAKVKEGLHSLTGEKVRLKFAVFT